MKHKAGLKNSLHRIAMAPGEFEHSDLPMHYELFSIFLFISVAVTAAEKPLSMLTTATPAVQLFNIVKRAERPSKLEP